MEAEGDEERREEREERGGGEHDAVRGGEGRGREAAEVASGSVSDGLTWDLLK